MTDIPQRNVPTLPFVCPHGHRHDVGAAFCTACGAGPVLRDPLPSRYDDGHYETCAIRAGDPCDCPKADILIEATPRYRGTSWDQEWQERGDDHP